MVISMIRLSRDWPALSAVTCMTKFELCSAILTCCVVSPFCLGARSKTSFLLASFSTECSDFSGDDSGNYELNRTLLYLLIPCEIEYLSSSAISLLSSCFVYNILLISMCENPWLILHKCLLNRLVLRRGLWLQQRILFLRANLIFVSRE